MNGLIDTVMDKLGGGGIATIAGMLGVEQPQAKTAVATATTVLTAALAKNAAKPEGAQALDSALARDHDGGILEDITGFLGGFASGPGAGILGHVLGSSQPAVEQKVAEKSGLSMDKVVPLLMMLAPIVMGALGKMKKDKGMDASAVASTLEAEKRQAEAKDDGFLGSVLGMLGDMGGGGGAIPASSSGKSGGGLGGILSAVGGLFGKKKKKGS